MHLNIVKKTTSKGLLLMDTFWGPSTLVFIDCASCLLFGYSCSLKSPQTVATFALHSLPNTKVNICSAVLQRTKDCHTVVLSRTAFKTPTKASEFLNQQEILGSRSTQILVHFSMSCPCLLIVYAQLKTDYAYSNTSFLVLAWMHSSVYQKATMHDERIWTSLMFIQTATERTFCLFPCVLSLLMHWWLSC